MNRATAAAPTFVPSRLSGIAGDFARNAGRIGEFFPRHFSNPSDLVVRRREVNEMRSRTALWSKARAVAERLGASPRSLANLELLAAGDAHCVTTGQQPGALGGSLLVIYKAMTAIREAASLAQAGDRPVVPIFWVAADDSDFAEVAGTVLATAQGKLERRALAGGTLAAGGMVGGTAARETLDLLHTFPAASEFGPRAGGVFQRVEEVVQRAADHGEVMAGILYQWFAEAGIVVIDGRWPELREGARDLFERWLDQRPAVEEECWQRGKALEAAGYHAQLSEGSVRGGLFEIRDRRRLAFEGDADALRRRIREAPETLSPNVVLRPLVQDSLLPNLATVVGPSEIAYHAQLVPVYARLGVALPLLIPRLEMTLVPPAVVRLAARRREPVESFVFDYDAAMKRTSRAAVPPSVGAAVDHLQSTVQEALERLQREAGAFDERLSQSLNETARRLGEVVSRACERVEESSREMERRTDPELRYVKDFLMPFRSPQERILGALTLFLAWEDPLHRIAECADLHRAHLQSLDPIHVLVDLPETERGSE